MATLDQYLAICEEPSEEYDVFSEAMATVRLDCLAGYASTTRKTIQDHGNPEVSKVDSPIFGSYHVHFPVRFKDRVTWLLRVPANVASSGDSDASAFRDHAIARPPSQFQKSSHSAILVTMSSTVRFS